MLAAIDIHKAVFQAAVLDPSSGETTEQRFKASREALAAWIEGCDGELDVVAIEATTGWRWVARELQARGVDVRLTDPGQASALQGARKRPKNDRLDARWLVMLLAREMLPEAWLAPEEIQRLRDRTRLRKALTDDHTRWAQRLHAVLVHEGWPCSRGSLLTAGGRRWVAALRLDPGARAQVDTMLGVMATLAHQIGAGRELRAARVVHLPLLAGPRLAGLPYDAAGFVLADDDLTVGGDDCVFAIGDGTASPFKQGGLAAQQADAVAERIAVRAGASERAPRPYAPTLRGLLRTEHRPRYLRAERPGGGGALVQRRGAPTGAPRSSTDDASSLRG